jgi:hypothetical protein
MYHNRRYNTMEINIKMERNEFVDGIFNIVSSIPALLYEREAYVIELDTLCSENYMESIVDREALVNMTQKSIEAVDREIKGLVNLATLMVKGADQTGENRISSNDYSTLLNSISNVVDIIADKTKEIV